MIRPYVRSYNLKNSPNNNRVKVYEDVVSPIKVERSRISSNQIVIDCYGESV